MISTSFELTLSQGTLYSNWHGSVWTDLILAGMKTLYLTVSAVMRKSLE